MFGFWRAFHELLPLGAGGLAVLVTVLLAWRRLGLSGRRRAALAFLVVWALGLLLVTLRPQPCFLDALGHRQCRGMDLVPFREIYDNFAQSVTWHVAVEQILGNLVLFAPLGVGLALRTYPRRLHWSAGFAAGTVVGSLIEVAQWFVAVGRITATDDVLLAALGSGLAALATTAILPLIDPAAGLAREQRPALATSSNPTQPRRAEPSVE
jgi:glycopeptide antibiotics resistance protein